MRQLLEVDPEGFTRLAMPATDRAALPSSLQGLVERRLSGRGSFSMYCVFPTNHAAEPHESHANLKAGFRREVRMDGVTYDARVFGNWREVQTVQEATIEGVALDDVIALGDSATPAQQADAGAPIIQAAPTKSAPNTVLYMIARFSDETGDPVSASTALSQMTVLSNFWMNTSYGLVSIHGLVNVTQPVDIVQITLPQPSSYAATYNNNLSELLSDARSAAATQGYDYRNYNLDVLVTTSSGFSYAGRAYVGGQGAHLVAGYTSLRTAGHELGHNLGLYHADYWRTDSTAPFGKDSVPGGYCVDSANAEWVEYGHYFSIMAAQSGGEIDDATKPHYAAAEKVSLGWLSGSRVQYVSTSGTYRLYRHDHRDVTNNPRGIRIETPATDYTGKARRYWLNYRCAPWSTAQNWLRQGLQVDVCQSSYGSDGATLLDMTPFSKDAATPFYDPDNQPGSFWTIDNSDKLDSALVVGRTYSDKTAGIHITPLATGNSGANQEFIDMAINLGSFPANAAPRLTSFTASTNQVAAGQTVSFLVNATDAEGDALAYAWDFDETQVWTASGLNTNSATKSWSTPGQYRVQVTVSDMKGGVASDSIVVTVGAPAANRQILGRVLWSGNPVAGARVYATLGSITRQAFTESDGSYALAGLEAAEGWTVYCRMDGLTLTAQFINPVSVLTGSAYGKDFFVNESLPSPGGTTYAILGQVTDGASGVAGVEVSAGGIFAITDASGKYTISNLVNGAYTLAARADTWSFTPTNSTVTISGANVTNNFARTAPYSITGRFYGPSASGNATAPKVFLSNGRTVTATKAGFPTRYWQYTLTAPAGSYAMGAEMSGYYFFSTNFINPLTLDASLSGINFVGTNAAASGALAGKITELNLPLTDVVLEARLGGELIATVQSDSDGCFRFAQLTNAAYTLTPAKPGYLFSPASYTVASVPASGISFAATGNNVAPQITSASATPNPAPNPATAVTLAVAAAGQEPMDYSWLAVTAPGPVSFSTNDGPGAAATTVSFLNAGNYVFRAKVRDARGFTSTTNLTMVVNPTAGQMIVSPYEIQLTSGQSASFSAAAWNGLGARTSIAPEWSVNGEGDITTNGVFVATMPGGPFDVVATAGTLSATGKVWVTGEYLPVISIETTAVSTVETDQSPLAVFVTRAGNSNSSVTVNLALGGSASYPADYSLAGVDSVAAGAARVTLAPGQTHAELILTPKDDAIAEGNETIALTVVGSANYYGGVSTNATLTIVDDDPQALLLSADQIHVPEGSANGFTIQLQAEPTVAVTVTTTRSSGDPNLTVTTGQSLTFTPANWDLPQTVTIAAAEDPDAVSGSATFFVASSGLASHLLSAVENENDAQFIVVSTNALLIPEGSSGSLLVSLNAQPTGNLNVQLALQGDAGLSLASSSALLFTTNTWNVPQPVMILAADDLDLTNSGALLTLSAPDLSEVTVALTETDTDRLRLVVSTNELWVAEAGTNALEIWLNVQPTNAVLVNLSLSGDTNLTLPAPAPLTFTPADWAVAQTVGVAALRDTNPTNDYATLSFSAPDLTEVDVTVLAIDDAPVVKVQTVASPATEWGRVPGTLLISRTGDNSQSLAVQFSLAGSATEGVDYETLPKPAVLPSGSNTITLTVLPLTDAQAEGSETVELTLQSDSTYALADASSAQLVIQDQPIDQWRFKRFTTGELADASISGDDADPDQDGIVNVLEYAFGLNPRTPDASGQPQATIEADHLTLHYQQNKDAVDVTFVPEVRDKLDAGGWSGDGLVELGRVDFGSYWMVSRYDSTYTTNAPMRFMRLKITRP